MTVCRLTIAALAFSTMCHSCLAGGPAKFQHENSPQNLKAIFEQFHQAVYVRDNQKEAAAFFRSLSPDEARVKKALKDNASPEAVRQIVELHKKFAVGDAEVRKVARPEQKSVRVHAATTEEIAKYENGSIAFKAFPGGAKRLAEEILRPGTTFYEVEFLEPGKDAGIKYHLFYWDGTQWSMLGPVWRVLK